MYGNKKEIDQRRMGGHDRYGHVIHTPVRCDIETALESSLNDTGEKKSVGTAEQTDTPSETRQPPTEERNPFLRLSAV